MLWPATLISRFYSTQGVWVLPLRMEGFWRHFLKPERRLNDSRRNVLHPSHSVRKPLFMPTSSDSIFLFQEHFRNTHEEQLLQLEKKSVINIEGWTNKILLFKQFHIFRFQLCFSFCLYLILLSQFNLLCDYYTRLQLWRRLKNLFIQHNLHM